jgi:hypothetical protein
MANEIISHNEMCRREGMSLQRGMNFRNRQPHSVILMSVRKGAPYRDRLEDGGSVLIYEGHDQPRRTHGPAPKTLDQTAKTPTGRATENGKFYDAARKHKFAGTVPERVRVYEKILSGIWSYNGVFNLVDAWQESDGIRTVFRFKLVAVEEIDVSAKPTHEPERRRIIPSQIKMEVWKRDGGKCVVCGAIDELHFDHDLPYSKGGTSILAENVQLLCARHNLQKHNRIE